MWQLWILNTRRFEKVGPPQGDVESNLWLQVLEQHFKGEVQLRPVPPPLKIARERTRWPGE